VLLDFLGENEKAKEHIVSAHPNHDPTGWRKLPASFQPLDSKKIEELLSEEWDRFRATYPLSGQHNQRSGKTLPLGVTSSFQHWDPYPITVVKSRGAYVIDVDGRKLLDLSMGFGAMLAGHLNPKVVREVQKTLRKTGTLFATPSTTATEAAEKLKKRFGLDMIRFTNSGTESTMYTIRIAKAVTRKKGLVKIEGGFHGGYDALQVSVKPKLENIGPADKPIPYVPFEVEAGEIYTVSYNDADGLEAIFKERGDSIAALMMEPIVENLSIILPDEGYLRRVRDLCDQYNVCLIFDEVKTGLTAGVAGAAKRVGVEPDLVCLAKSIGGGLPVAAFGGRQKYMDAVVDGRMPHLGTYNGSPIVLAAALAMDAISTEDEISRAEKINIETLRKLDEVIEKYQLPAHTVGFGVKGAVTWSPNPVRNYRDFKALDFKLAELSWIWGINRGVLTPPGLDEQWLVSFAHKQKDMDLLVRAFEELGAALRS
jgi:glutamate-1-semialdehyde 2,1-aminomutase